MSTRQSQALGLEVALSSLAREFGMARETISKRLLAAGVQPSGRNKGNDVFRVGAAARAIVVADYVGTSGPVVNPDLLGPKDRNDYWRSENEKLKFERDSSLVIDVPDHEYAIVELGKIFLLAAETIPDILERRCGLDPVQLESVENAINEVREQLAEKLETYSS